jgi:hypothetical protein
VFSEEITMPALTFPMQFAARTPALSSCTWTAQDIETLYEGLMFRSLQQLFNAHSSVELRCDVNDWIFGDRLLGPKGTPRAFSFEATCRWLGLDPVEVRSQVLNLMVRTGVMDLIDENRMAVADKRRGNPSTARPASIQLGFFEEEEAILTPRFHRLKTIFRDDDHTVGVPQTLRHEVLRTDFAAFLDGLQLSLL